MGGGRFGSAGLPCAAAAAGPAYQYELPPALRVRTSVGPGSWSPTPLVSPRKPRRHRDHAAYADFSSASNIREKGDLCRHALWSRKSSRCIA